MKGGLRGEWGRDPHCPRSAKAPAPEGDRRAGRSTPRPKRETAGCRRKSQESVGDRPAERSIPGPAGSEGAAGSDMRIAARAPAADWWAVG
jgi:hypothetical protein